jgi:2-oxoglutarate dehydrogenase E2 component (dihydrolipoamide succinyltransferase)
MATIELKVPALGESITEALIAKWLKNVGEPIAIDEPVVDLETDKVSVAINAPQAGVLAEQRAAAGATVKVGDVVGTISSEPELVVKKNVAASEKPVPKPAPTPQVAPAPEPERAVQLLQASHPTPTTRKAMREGAKPRPSAPTGNGQPTQAPQAPQAGEEVVAMTPLRKRIAERLVEAQHTAAILTTFNEVDMSAIMALRAKYQEQFVQRHGIKLGFMSFFVRACVESLREWPGLNAELRGNDVVYKRFYHFGIAVGGGKGLVVPVVRDVDTLSMAEIEQRIAELAKKAKENKLALEELQGGTFSITNGGIYGSMMSTPLLNMPQTGILGMHNIVKRAMVVGDEVKVRPMMYVALSYDHRVVDGREAVSFLVGVKERLEAPERMLLEV